VNNDDRAVRLAGRLRDLRKAAGYTGISLAAKLGWTQSKISKIETCRTTPDTPDITAWAAATGAEAAVTAELVDLLTEIRAAQLEWQTRFRQGQAKVQQGYAKLARDAKLIRCLDISAIPGLLQTPEYARIRLMEGVRRHGADSAKLDDAVAARVQRGQLLFDMSRQFEFVICEPALRWTLAPADVMRAQLAQVLTLAGLPNVTVGILPFGVPLDDTPQHAWISFDDTAIVENLVEEHSYVDERSAVFAAVFEDYLSRSLVGDDARRLIVAAADAL
jgi:transcriptional regulator with XRE-family HTH domain